MMIKKVVMTVSLLCSVFFTVISVAEETLPLRQDPSMFTQKVVETQVLSVLNQYKDTLASNPQSAIDQIEKNLKPYINIDLMSTYVIPPDIWNAASAQDKERFENVFFDFIASIYGSAVKNFQNNGFVFRPMRDESWKTASRVMVYSTITNADGTPGVAVSYVLGYNSDRWMFLDFVVEGSISAIQSIKQQIQSIVQQKQSENRGKALVLNDITAVIEVHVQKTAS